MIGEMWFKAKSLATGRWIEDTNYNFEISLLKGVQISIGFVPVDPKTLCVFIGKRDREGKKVYSGDVLEWVNSEDPTEKDTITIYYDEDLCSFMGKSNQATIPVDLSGELNEFVIISNIYDVKSEPLFETDFLWHVIRRTSKNGKLVVQIRRCSVQSYKLRMKRYEDDGMYFRTKESAIEAREKILQGV